MIIIQCDRCHCAIRNSEKSNAGKKIGKYMVIRTYQDDVNIRSIDRHSHKPLDLCPDCAGKLADFIDGYVDKTMSTLT